MQDRRDDDRSSAAPPLPTDARCHNQLGSLFSTSKKYASAIAHFEKALALAPTYASAHYNLANALAFSKCDANQNRVVHHYQQAVLHQPHFPEAHVNLAAQLYAEGQCSIALTHALNAIAQDPDNCHGYYNLNTIYRALGEQDKAVDMCWKRIACLCDSPRPSIAQLCDVLSDGRQPHDEPHVTVVCVKWGSKYGPDYVNKLYRGVAKYLSTVDFTFVCLTDNPDGLLPEIETRALESGWSGWWNKAQLFSPHFQWHGRMLYIDLDTVITGSLVDLALYDGAFGTLKTDEMQNERRVGGINSSVMCWNAGHPSIEIIYMFLQRHFDIVSKVIYKFDHWLEMVLTHDYDVLQDLFPLQIVEFMQVCQDDIPPQAKLVCFPLEPKPHMATAPWVAHYWL
ncbi:Aste57867_25131 [Aphanomyces stellatus]|uniref:Aste57867_25131 protein n=1 Tax=Aphanomyces stellatus TaxID=120398 RepID=A0A485LT11_9STRA|nr:hypothetical protein As57867_025053 [Aphanomyces stellatus]VFU01762.1 Aste57867_25131 [Aphanomyces stellatus]